MNMIVIIGNLTRDPETGTTQGGVNWTRFSVAVRRPFAQQGQPDADFMRVTAWRKLGETCAKYLAKGRKVAVVGRAESHAWMDKDGAPRSQLELTATDVEFISAKPQDDQPQQAPPEEPGAYVEVTDEEMPF